MKAYYGISPEELGKGAKIPVLKVGDSGEAFYELAKEILNNSDTDEEAHCVHRSRGPRWPVPHFRSPGK